MKKNINKTIKLGFFVITSIILFVLAIYFIGSKNNLFNAKVDVYTVFNDIRGLMPGNNVRFSGINVGNVKSIDITSDSTVVLRLSIRKDYAKFIYRNSIVEIGQDGLMGSKLLLISSGTPNAGPIQEGDRLGAKYGIDIENMLAQTQDILVDAKSAMSNLGMITSKINSGEGDLGELLTKKTLTTKLAATTDNLNNTLTQIGGITRKINNGQGDLGRLVNNNDLTSEAKTVLTNLNQTAKKANDVIADLSVTAKSINTGEGSVSLLLNNKRTAGNVDTTIIKVNTGIDQFNRTAKAIENSWILNIFNKKKKKDDKTSVPQSKTDSVK